MLASKHYEVVKVLNQTNHVYNVGVMMASKRKLDSLPPQYREAIRAASKEMTPDWRKTIAEKTDEAVTAISAAGVAIQAVDRPAYRAALQPVYDQFRPTIGAELMDEVVSQAS